MSETRTPAHMRAHGENPLARWGGDDGAYAEAFANAEKHIVAGHSLSEERAIYTGKDMPMASYARVLRPAKGLAVTERCTAAEVQEMARLYAELREDPELGELKICHRISARLTRPRSPACVSDKLAKAGVRPLGTAGKPVHAGRPRP